jgi:hypothetical protein
MPPETKVALLWKIATAITQQDVLSTSSPDGDLGKAGDKSHAHLVRNIFLNLIYLVS